MPKTKKPEPDAMAVNQDGQSLPMTPEEVRAHVFHIMKNPNGLGRIIALIIENGDDIAVPVFGPPSRETLEILKAAVRAYERTLRGH
jgi:hypothetical protein